MSEGRRQMAKTAMRIEEVVSKILHTVQDFLAEKLGYFEHWLLITGITAFVSSLAIGLFYFMLKFIILISAWIHGILAPGTGELEATDYAVIALMSENWLAIPVTILLFTSIASILVYKLAPEAEGAGTDPVVEAYHHAGGLIRPRVAIVKAIASALVLGGGGSAGPEGPAVQIGGAAASFASRLLHLRVEERKAAVIAGVAAALSFIFQSPVGAAMFAIEVLYVYDMETAALAPSLIASVLAYALSLHILGPQHKLPSITLPDPAVLYSFDSLASYILLGILMGALALLYIYVFKSTKKLFERLVEEKKISLYLKPLIGASAVALIGIVFPQVLGTGEEYLSEKLQEFQSVYVYDKALVIKLMMLAIAKIVATSLFVGSGGSGGLLAPGLFAGALSGMAFGLFVSSFTNVHPSVYAYLGMAALFGAASCTPLGMSFLVAEIGGTPALIVPALVSSLTANLVTMLNSIVESQLPRRVPPQVFTVESLLRVLREKGVCIPVKEAMSKSAVVAKWNEPISAVAERLISTGQRVAVVVSEDNVVVGVLDPAYAGIDIGYALRSREPVAEVTIASAPTVRVNDCIIRALEQMVLYGTEYVVVVDTKRRYQGIVYLEDVVNLMLPRMVSRRTQSR
jgi:CIC family chloride channel protein